MSCPYCGNNKSKKSYLQSTKFNNKIFDYNCCTICHVIYLNPFPIEEDYDKMYPTTYQGDLNLSDNERYKELFLDIKRINPNCVTILDYGCGNAELLVNANAFGFSTHGIEYNPLMVTKLNDFFTEIKFHSVEEFNEEKNLIKYDVIVLNNVLEHVTNPNELLLKLQNHLSENGLLIVLGPIENNFNIALQFRKILFKLKKITSKSFANHAPYHVTFTNYENQREIFVRNNFQELYLIVNEVAWPFPDKLNYNSPNLFLKSFIAKISIKCSKFFNKNAGNMFTYIGKKNQI